MGALAERARAFLESLGFRVQSEDGDVLGFKEIYGTDLAYLLREEDRVSFSQLPDYRTYFARLAPRRGAHEGGKVWVLVPEEVKGAKTRFDDFCRVASGYDVKVGSLREFLDSFVPREKIRERLRQVTAASRQSIGYVNRSVRAGVEEYADGVRHLADSWLHRAGEPRLMVLHGPAGYGKSVLAERLVEDVTELVARDPRHPTPLLVRFSDHRDVRSVDALLAGALNWYGANELTVKGLRQLVKLGRVTLVLDGFDELSEEAGEKLSPQNVRTLAELIRGASEAKVLLTARSSFVETDRAFAQMGGFASAELCPLGEDQFREFLEKNPPEGLPPDQQPRHRDRCLHLIREDEDLAELCANPLLLRWISDVVAKNPARLPRSRPEVYGAFSAEMFARDRVRQNYDLGDDVQGRFLGRVACVMVVDGAYVCPADFVDMCAEEVLATLGAATGPGERRSELVARLRIHGMLNPPAGKGGGDLSFIHDSLRDFFAARFLATLIEGWPGDRSALSSVIAQRAVPEGVASFLGECLSAEAEAKLAQLAAREPAGYLARNAFVSATRSSDAERVKRIFPSLRLPSMNLRGLSVEGAELDGFSFPDADLDGTSFTSCSLTNADFRAARLHNTSFDDCDLSGSLFDYPVAFPLKLDGRRFDGPEPLAHALAAAGAGVGGFSAAVEREKVTPHSLLRHVVKKFYKGDRLESARLADREMSSLLRGKAGRERGYVMKHVVPGLAAHGFLATRRRAGRSPEVLRVNPARNAELVRFLFQGTVSEDLGALLRELPPL